MSEELIHLEQVSYHYEDAAALENLSFSISKAECIGIAGDNGCGKTTLMKLLNGLLFPDHGRWEFKGQEINETAMKDPKIARALHASIGYVFQNPEVQLFCASVKEEIAFGPRQLGLSEAEVAQRTEDVMKMMGLESLALRPPYHLSGGEQKKTALACVLSMNPEVLILDEPLNGLDRKSREWMLSFLNQWKEAGKTLLISSHDERLLRSVPERIIELSESHTIRFDGPK
ncbi:MAG: energy-coupling factor ABC transporter ATP-binding protein, partial [Bulleidia sp.]